MTVLKLTILSILVICTLELRAQFTVQQGTLSTSKTSVVSIQGDMNARGAVNNQGALLLHNHLLGSDRFVSSTGSLHLLGSDQNIQIESSSLSSLLILGGGTKHFGGKLIVLQELSLDNGILRTNTSSQLILSPSAQINGGSSESYVDGFLYHSGTGKKFYPVGKDGTYAPATLLNVSGDNPTVGVAYFPFAKLDGAKFHWQQSVLDGTYDGSASELTFTSEDADYQEYSSRLVVLATEDGSEEYIPLGQSALSTQRTRFTISSEQSTTLPILTVGFDTPMSTKHLYLPNAFSPTAPNTEDRCIKLYGQGISSNNFYLAIQDVWGNIVYETSSKEEASSQGWEGLATTSSIATTYRYRLTGAFIGGKRFQQTGTIVQY